MQSKIISTIVDKPRKLSTRIKWLRDYYFKGTKREWNNEFVSWTTGTRWDTQFNEMNYYIVPENYLLFDTMTSSFRQSAHPVILPNGFWKLPQVQRRAWFVKEVMTKYMPCEILHGDLIAGGRFNVQTSMCLTEKESKIVNRLTKGKNGARKKVKWFHDHGYGNAGATSGHIIPHHEKILKIGWKGIFFELESKYNRFNLLDRIGRKGNQLRAMMTSATMARDLSARYAKLCSDLILGEKDSDRKNELTKMRENLNQIGWNPPRDFWEAVQALWLNHMLVMSDENYPGPGLSFGRIDQYLLPYWQKSIANGMDREFGKEILKCFFIHANTAYDAFIRAGYQGITSGFGQLITLGGMGKDGCDLTNELTLIFLEVIDEMSPILEPKPNIRLHRNSPDLLLDKIIDMISRNHGAPFLLNFDERSIAGMLRESRMAQLKKLINENNVHDYAPVGCLENSMVGNDRSGTVDANLNLLKAVELALNSGRDLLPFIDPITGKKEKIVQNGPKTCDSSKMTKWGDFWSAFCDQMRYIVTKCVEVYEYSENIRSKYFETPYLSCLIDGCIEKGVDVTKSGANINFVTMEAVTFATTVDSLLAIKYLVFDKKLCTMDELKKALCDNWKNHKVLQGYARFKAPKYGRDDDVADKMAQDVMEFWTDECWKHKTKSTNRQFRPGMLSWNYWVSDGYVLPASPDGRESGKFLSNAICPTSGQDINGPTSNVNSVGKVLGGKTSKNKGDYLDFVNYLPNGASHTITFNPEILHNKEHKDKFKGFLKGYVENGGTALQINMLDVNMLKEAQKNPTEYQNLLVRVTGYNAYFTSIGRELQNEVIARISHNRF